MLIVICDAFDAGLSDKLTRFGEVSDDAARLAEADVALVRSKTKCTKAWIDAAPRLKLIIRGGVGTDNIDKAYAAERGIAVRNTPRASAIAVAELAMALIIAVPNRLIPAHEGMEQGRWLKKELKRTELHGKTLCLVGMGNIASEVAKRARAFGMRVIAHRKSNRPHELAYVYPTLEESLPQADYVSLHTPLTDDTRGMINKKTLALMKPGAVLINTGRGDCVVPEDIKEALERGRLRAYATDVWPSDPPPEDYPLLHTPGVLMTPHLGANSVENLLRIGDEVERIIEELQGDLT